MGPFLQFSFSVHLLPTKDIRHDSPGGGSPLSTQLVQFCQQEGRTSLQLCFNPQCLKKLPRTTSKKQANKKLRLTSQSPL